MTDVRSAPLDSRSDEHRDRSESLDRLYRELWSDVCRFVQRKFGAGPPEPEEVAQAAFERLSSVESLADIQNPRGLLFTIATNIVRDQHRRGNVRATVHRDIAYFNQDLGLSDSSPECVLEAKERLAAFKVALARMPEVRRRVFLFVRIEGLSVTDAARQFAMSEGAVYKHVSRAMHDCLAALDELARPNEGLK